MGKEEGEHEGTAKRREQFTIMPRYRDPPLDCRVYVGDLPRDASEKELERSFSYYGPLKNVWVARNPPGFAFVEFEDPRDADDSVRGIDGTTICGVRVGVEHSTGKVRPKPWMRRGPPRIRRPFDPDDGCYECGERGHYAYDCSRDRRGRRRSRSRSRSRSYDRYRKRSYSRSRSRSRSREKRRSYSRSPRRVSRSKS